MIRVLIAAPTPALRAGLRALVATSELQIAGETSTLALLDVDIASVFLLVRCTRVRSIRNCFHER